MGFILGLLGMGKAIWSFVTGVVTTILGNPTLRLILAFVVLAVIILALWLHGAKLGHELADARAALKNPATGQTWQAEAGVCAGNLARVSRSLDVQSAAVAQLQAAGKTATDAANIKVRAASVISDKLDQRAASVLAADPKGDACAAAVDILKGKYG